MARSPSGTVTFLFTDIEGSTRRWEADADAMRVELAAHDEVLRAAIDADIGAILGWGYPPFRGGPVGWLHTLGLPAAVAALDRLVAQHGPRFAPPQILRDMAKEGESFYPA